MRESPTLVYHPKIPQIVSDFPAQDGKRWVGHSPETQIYEVINDVKLYKSFRVRSSTSHLT